VRQEIQDPRVKVILEILVIQEQVVVLVQRVKALPVKLDQRVIQDLQDKALQVKQAVPVTQVAQDRQEVLVARGQVAVRVPQGQRVHLETLVIQERQVQQETLALLEILEQPVLQDPQDQQV
jgi:hypothetical protein